MHFSEVILWLWLYGRSFVVDVTLVLLHPSIQVPVTCKQTVMDLIVTFLRCLSFSSSQYNPLSKNQLQ